MIRLQIVAMLSVLCCATVPSHDWPQVSASFNYSNTVDLGPIQDEQLAMVLIEFQRVTKTEREVTLRIDSPGGSIFAGQQWTREMEDIKKRRNVRVTCIVDGLAASMAAVILESPLCDLRLATTRSLILFHNGSSGARGTAEELRGTIALLDAINESMALVVSERLGISLNAYRAKIATADWVMAVNEALIVSAIDGLIDSREIAPPSGVN